MLHINIICVGKLKEKYLQELTAEEKFNLGFDLLAD